MEENSEQDKSEEPSFFKLKKAREEGSVARGMDLAFFTSVGAFAVWFWLLGSRFGERLSLVAEQTFASAGVVNGGGSELMALTGAVFAAIARPFAFMALIVFGVVLAFEFLQTGVVFTTKPLKLDFKRLNPASNLKKLFTFRILIETGKNILKLAVYGAITWLVIRDGQEKIALAITDAASLAAALTSTTFRLLLFYIAAAAAFALIDQAIVRREYRKKMRMSRRELKREVRDREGDARMKQRRKQLHAEFVKLSQSLKGVRGADILITNPTHYAVGLRYQPSSHDAPLVVAKGIDQVALRLRRLAFVYGVTVIEDRQLARAIYHGADLNQPIPESSFRRVADIYLARGKAAKGGAGPADA